MDNKNAVSGGEIEGRWRGHLALIFANICWGVMSPVTKSVLNTNVISPLGLSSLRILGGAVLFVLGAFILRAFGKEREIVEYKDLLRIFIASILIITCNQALYIVGIGYTSPIDSSVVSTLTPIFTMIFAAMFISEKITPLKALGVLVGSLGALILIFVSTGSTANATSPLLGNSLCLIAQLCAALYYVIFKDIINKYSPFTLMKYMFVFSAVTIIPFTWKDVAGADYASMDIEIIIDILFIVVFATFISYLLIPFSQRLLKPTVVSMYNYLQPVTSAVLSTFLGLAAFGGTKIFATALIFSGVWFVTQSRNTQTWSFKKKH
ncbi:MAG: DMT family transporter [Muribaculaceae bacterium]|nr:DMT family transporter [Muribaculaceae bacterium]